MKTPCDIRTDAGERAQRSVAGIWARSTARRDGIDPPLAAAEYLPGIQAALSHAGASLQIVSDGGEAVGFSLVVPREDRLELLHLAVDPARWGEGIAQRLLRRLDDDAAERGYSTLELWAIDANDRAVALYKAAGWQSTGDVAVRGPAGRLERRLIRLPLTRVTAGPGARRAHDPRGLGR